MDGWPSVNILDIVDMPIPADRESFRYSFRFTYYRE